jgi:VWFA-related protein
MARTNPLISAALACLAGLALSGQQPVTLRTNVHAVEVSIVASDSKQQPVTGLTAADFRVWDNGREQRVASVEMLDARTAPRAPLPPGVYSNRVGKTARPQVVSVILLDAMNTKMRLQTVMLRLLESVLEQIEPEDRVAICAVGRQLRVLHDFSSDHASLLARLKGYHGEIPLMDDAIQDLDLDSRAANPPSLQFQASMDEARAIDTLEVMQAIAGRLKGIPGRKNLIWVSGSFPLFGSVPSVTSTAKPLDFANPNSVWTNRRMVGASKLARAVAALNDAGVSVYPVDARGLSVNGAVNMNINTMREIGFATGGKGFYNRNDRGRGVRLALEDSRVAYVLTYSPGELTYDGAYHEIRVKTTRPGVTLRFRRGYFAPDGTETAPVSLAAHLDGVLRSPLDTSEIGIQASLEPPKDDGELAIAVRLDPLDLSLALNAGRWTGALRLEAVQTGATGERFEGVTQTAQLDLLPETYQQALTQGLLIHMPLKRGPAAIAVRVGVVDEGSGRVGSLTLPVPHPAASSQ